MPLPKSGMLVEAVESSCVGEADLLFFFVSAIGEDFGEDLPGAWPGRLPVGVVGAEHDVVDTDDVAQGDAEGVFLE